ncbi:MAG TPA: tail fiber protein [Rhizomicrobium sp.]|nr:tail fiber protein [Rhizomicrobium sp.]
MSEPYVAQVMLFAFNFAPRSYAFANGATIAISQNEALFSIIGTTYGGNGQTTFQLPNIQEKGVMNIGQGPGLSNYVLGEVTGVDNVTLLQNQIPVHNHTLSASAGSQSELLPTQNGWYGSVALPGKLFSTNSPDTNMNAQAISMAGGSQPHMNQQPYLAMNYCIALYGIFPSRN